MKKKVLLIDDDKELSEEMIDFLIAEGYIVQTAYDGLQAENLIHKSRYDIILLDLKMPNLNGIDLLKRLKKIDLKSKIILISGKPFLDKEIKKHGLLPMISGFIRKPYDVKKLLDTIRLI
jgi:DNA-binding response OmpR family regulator